MRYWHPMSRETAGHVKTFAPDDVVLLPLYPQFSTTTTASSIAAWREAARAVGLNVPTFAVCCYGEDGGFIDAHVGLLQAAHREAAAAGNPRVLFSAHGLPKKVIQRGDPYQRQIERTAKRIVDASGLAGLDWIVCYQSRVGPLEWIGPSTEDELGRAGRDKVPVVVVPVSFVSEHSETLVELDIEYRALAERAGVPRYVRVPALGTNAAFIRALARLVGQARAAKQPVAHGAGAHERSAACLSVEEMR
jgi:ferrochelatase